jgi:CheY-like chemotaxis protein
MLAGRMVAGRQLPRVLIVDDQPDMARSLARLFWEVANVATSGSGEEALARIEQGERFDLVLCDIMMPGMTGLDLFERVRVVDPTTANAFVFATGGISPEFEARLAATGRRCLMKPCDAADLKRLLEPEAQV